MKALLLMGTLLLLVVTGCATPGRGEQVGASVVGSLTNVGADVAFDHNCPKDRIRVIRSEQSTMDLDVCGVVRRYKPVSSGGANTSGYTWLDVTALYPASVLPPPLPPQAGK